MKKEALIKMREAEDILLDVMKGIKLKADQLGVLKPAELEAAKVLAELMRIEAEINKTEKDDDPDPDPHMLEEIEQEPVSVGEDRDFICRQLAKLLQHTRAGSGIRDITRSQETPHADEFATIKYSNGYNQFVNITADSGIAIIKDICKAIS